MKTHHILLLLIASAAVHSSCATGSLIENERFQRHATVTTPASAETPILRALTDRTQTKLALGYSVVGHDQKQRTVWLNIDTASVLIPVRDGKFEVGAPDGTYFDPQWFDANVEHGPFAHRGDIDRCGKLFTVWDSERYQASRPRWDVRGWTSVDVYGVTPNAKVRTDEAGTVGIDQDARCWFTVKLPEDHGGGCGIIAFDLPNFDIRTGAFYALAPFAVIADVATAPLMVPVVVVGNAGIASGSKEP